MKEIIYRAAGPCIEWKIFGGQFAKAKRRPGQTDQDKEEQSRYSAARKRSSQWGYAEWIG
jgi:hypothetical protein